MALPIEDYALIGDCFTAALVGRDGSIDWLCLPRYDSGSIFASLLGDVDHGRWLLAPSEAGARSSRRYDGDSFTLITRWRTSTGVVEVTDSMPIGDHRADVLRRVRGIRGSVELKQDVRFRFDYGSSVPWVIQRRDEPQPILIATAGPNAVAMRGPALIGADRRHEGVFTIAEGEVVDITLTWYPSHREPPDPPDVSERLARTRDWWNEWGGRYDSRDGDTVPSGWNDAVKRSLLVLRALTHEATGGIVAAATTSLPEQFGGSRNWDYRYVWLRDASLTIDVLHEHGYDDEVDRWRGWLLRAIAGSPDDLQIMYGVAGERWLAERDLPKLPGYRLGDGEPAAPVRLGNAASEQFQADVIGEVMLALSHARRAGVPEDPVSWGLQRSLLGHLEKVWRIPDQGIWEIRGEPRAFTHSRAMAWAAFDRGVDAVENHRQHGPAVRWRRLRDEIGSELDTSHVDAQRGCFVQYPGTHDVDAALLQLPQVGFCAADDPRMLATVAAIEADLMHDGFISRYPTTSGVDGLPAGENPFLACNFWLAEQYARTGRLDDARELLDRLIGISNDLGLLSEEYDPRTKHQAGNTPQALSHLALVRAVDAYRRAAERRGIRHALAAGTEDSGEARLAWHDARYARRYPGSVTAPAPLDMDPHDYDHSHADVSGGALRAAVFGAMDGLVTNISLIAGIGAAGAGRSTLILTGLAGLVAGAFSMALGEYTSVTTQNEQLLNEAATEREALVRNPLGELHELARNFTDMGMSEETALLAATEVHEHPERALRVHITNELGVDPEQKPSPWTAAISSFLMFATGAVVPLIPYFFGSSPLWIPLTVGGAGLLVAGGIAARFSGKAVLRGALRQLVFGAIAVTATYLVGLAMGVSGAA